jgi:hypothetical protein
MSESPEALTIDGDAELVAFVVRSPKRLSSRQVDDVRATVTRLYAETKWAGIPVFVLEEGASLDLVQWPPKKVEGE